MAKKRTGDPIGDLLKSGQLMTGDDPRLDLRFLPTGIPQLDAITGGGIPYNRVVALVGAETTGKTALAQYVAAAAQKTDRPEVLLVDCEHSYDRRWWEGSGVDTAKLMVSQPTFGEQAIDVIVATLSAPNNRVGAVLLDSVAAMVPKAVVEADSADDKFVGRLPVLVNQMLAMVTPLIHDCVFVHCNQMRANIGGHEPVYPGGLGLKHGTHLRLWSRRDAWLKEKVAGSNELERVGFIMEVIVSKNKVGVPYGECQIPFRFAGQMDLIQSFLDQAVQQKVITDRSPYYVYEELDLKWLGKAAMREWFVENKGAFILLKSKLKDAS